VVAGRDAGTLQLANPDGRAGVHHRPDDTRLQLQPGAAALALIVVAPVPKGSPIMARKVTGRVEELRLVSFRLLRRCRCLPRPLGLPLRAAFGHRLSGDPAHVIALAFESDTHVARRRCCRVLRRKGRARHRLGPRGRR